MDPRQKEDRMKVFNSIKQALHPPTAHKSNKQSCKEGGKGRGLNRHMGRKVTHR